MTRALDEEQAPHIEGMPERPREDPAAAVDALERKVERECGDPIAAHVPEAVAEDAVPIPGEVEPPD